MELENINIKGIAHIALSVSNISNSKIFYKELLPFFGFKLVHESQKSCYHIGGRTAILIQQTTENNFNKFSQDNIGLHHFCFRASSELDINKVESKLKHMKVNIIRGPMYGPWVPGYYYILFEDPDHIRIEVNYVPNKGVFEKHVKFNPNNDY